MLSFAAAEHAVQSAPALKIGPGEGLPSEQVYDIDQRPTGEMVFLCRSGLADYNGRNWALDDTYLPLIDTAYHVEIGSDNSTWLAGNRTAVDLLHRKEKTWERIPLPESAHGTVLTELVLVDGAQGSQPLITTLEQGVLRWDGERWTQLPIARNGTRARVWGAKVWGSGVLLATDLGLALVRGESWSWELDEQLVRPTDASSESPGEGALLNLAVYGVAVDHRPGARDPGNIWVVGRNWVGELTAEGAIVRASELEHAHWQANGIQPRTEISNLFPAVADGAGGLWFGSEDFIQHYDSETGRVNPAILKDSDVSRGATDLFRDRAGSVWRSSGRGLTFTPSLRFVNLDRDDGLLETEVTALAMLPSGGIVFGHFRGLSILEDGVIRKLPLPSYAKHATSRTLELAVEADGTLWMARSYAGIQRMTPSGVVEDLPFPADVSAGGILLGDEGEVLVVTARGILQWSDGAFVSMPGGPPDARGLRRIVRLADGRLCALSDRVGVIIREDGTWTNYSHQETHEANNTYSALQEPDGRVLVATMAGLFAVSGDGLALPREPELRIEDPVYSILREADGRLWFGTSKGVARWDGVKLVRFSVAEGFAGYETNRCAALVDQRGHLWFGTVDGASHYRAEHDLTITPSLPVRLSRVEVGGREVPLDEPQHLAHDAGDLAFHFYATTFQHADDVEYQCRLVGYDSEWVEDEAAHTGLVRYTHLPPGDYRFEVRARMPGGAWSELVSSHSIVIDLPIWSRSWFVGAGLLATLALAVGANRLVTQRRRALALEQLVELRTRELRATEFRYRRIFEKSRAPQLLFDAETGRVSAANEAAVSYYGFEGGSLIGKSLAELSEDGDQGGPEAVLDVGVGEGHRFLATHKLANGRLRELALYASGDELEGRRVVQVILEDITERRELQEQLLVSQRMESVGLLAGGVAHDFNNILTVLMGNLELVMLQLSREGYSREEIQRRLEEIRESGERAANLTGQLLTFSRRQVVQVERVDVGRVLKSMEGMIRRLIRADVELELQLGAELGETLVDPTQLEQVIMNLVVNASDAMHQGGKLSISTAGVQLDEHHPAVQAGAGIEKSILLSVRDTGSGMDEVVRHRIFEPFFTTKPQGQGTGLGLSVIHGIVRQAGGAVEVESEVGQGTEFRVYLPVAEAEPASPPTPTAAPVDVRGIETVLLCEDDDALRQLLLQTLQVNGYNVIGAATPAIALDRARELPGRIEMIVSDVILPDINGRELVQLLRETQPQAGVLFISGYTANVIAPHGVLEEGTQFLAKPFTGKQLLLRVREILDGERPQSLLAEASAGRAREQPQ